MLLRADQWLVRHGLVESRTRAQQLIRDGRVKAVDSDGRTLALRPSTRFTADVNLRLVGDQPQQASRGALKLTAALDTFAVDVRGNICLDAGQSTGGFTDVLLAQGAARVVGIDVGHGQLITRLRNDERVVCLEQVNVRDCTLASIKTLVHTDTTVAAALEKGGFDCIVADLSFISLRKVLFVLRELLAPDANLVALVKPQFELGPGAVNRQGIVRDVQQAQALQPAFAVSCDAIGLTLCNWMASPVTGGNTSRPGNREFLMHAKPKWNNNE